MKRALVTAACVALVLAAAAAGTHMRWSGELGQYGNAVGLPVRVGSPFSVGMGQLQPGRRIRIESIELNHATPGVVVAGALVHPVGHGMVGSERSFPPTFPRIAMRPAKGAVLRADIPVALVVGLRATRPGPFRVQGVNVLYRERLAGVDVRRRARVGVEVVGCAVRTSARVPRCAVPAPTDD